MLGAAATTYTKVSSSAKDARYCSGNGTYLRFSSTIRRCMLKLMERIIHRSWLKLLRMTDMHLPSLPRVFDSDMRTLSNVTNAVPAVAEYAVFDWLGGKPVAARHRNDGVSAARLASNSEVVHERAIRYPPTRFR